MPWTPGTPTGSLNCLEAALLGLSSLELRRIPPREGRIPGKEAYLLQCRWPSTDHWRPVPQDGVPGARRTTEHGVRVYMFECTGYHASRFTVAHLDRSSGGTYHDLLTQAMPHFEHLQRWSALYTLPRLTLDVPPLERWEEPMRWLTPEQKTRIESAESYELLQREVARRFLAPSTK